MTFGREDHALTAHVAAPTAAPGRPNQAQRFVYTDADGLDAVAENYIVADRRITVDRHRWR